ncbi:MAG: hypothetical protein LUH49_00385 [Cloacibacillus porcorum]|uniref:hypothetical protein n=1 Tax=Cloacibacillus porcorum TaxID=1197717 RepID=UPI0023F31975|nr:hypothetical protein [Cloacibacillus porcorum]MCD7875431.1 hypothetical protein [Cloacibacillus porcorum]
MRYKEHKHERETKHSSLFVISFLCVFLCAAALGTLRLYGLYLEHRISETARRIDLCKEENLVLSRRYAQLLSPARVYNYARRDLGMNNAENIKVIKLDERSVRLAQVKEETVEKGGFIENLNPFVKQAHAKN